MTVASSPAPEGHTVTTTADGDVAQKLIARAGERVDGASISRSALRGRLAAARQTMRVRWPMPVPTQTGRDPISTAFEDMHLALQYLLTTHS